MREAVIVEAVRTPIGRRKGALSTVHPVDLAATTLIGLIERVRLPPEVVDDVYWGCVTQIAEQSSNVGRQAVLAADWPDSIPGVTIDRACGSSQQAIHFAAAAIASGQADVVIAGGVESMSTVPLGAARALGEPFGPRVRRRYQRDSFSQGEGAERIATTYGLSRQILDEYALESHRRAIRAIDSGAFEQQILAVAVGQEQVVRQDEGPRRDSTLEKLACLKPAFSESGRVTAASSSQISDGSAALLIMTAEKARELRLTPIARFRAFAAVGADPVTMLTAPIPATKMVLERAGLSVDDIDAFEVNEAFAPVPLAWQREFDVPSERLNPVGGAIALGHPLGASGAILMTRLLYHLRDSGGTLGLQTMCEAGGMANATVVEIMS